MYSKQYNTLTAALVEPSVPPVRNILLIILFISLAYVKIMFSVDPRGADF